MSPEERAAQVLLDPMGALVPEQSFDFIVERIAAAIRAAVRDEREACVLACDAISTDKHDQFKGRGQHALDNDHRADPHTEGESDGAGLCADAIRSR